MASLSSLVLVPQTAPEPHTVEFDECRRCPRPRLRPRESCPFPRRRRWPSRNTLVPQTAPVLQTPLPVPQTAPAPDSVLPFERLTEFFNGSKTAVGDAAVLPLGTAAESVQCAPDIEVTGPDSEDIVLAGITDSCYRIRGRAVQRESFCRGLHQPRFDRVGRQSRVPMHHQAAAPLTIGAAILVPLSR